MTEPQTLFNVIAGVAGALGGWVLKIVLDRLQELQQTDHRLSETINEVKDHYARRDDVREMVGDLKSMLIRIEAKLDTKADK